MLVAPAPPPTAPHRAAAITLLCAAGCVLAVVGPLLPLPLFQHWAASRYCPGARWCRPALAPAAAAAAAAAAAPAEQGPGQWQWWDWLLHPQPLYAFIQREYWGLGLFERWRVPQVPQFLLGAPMMAAALGSALVWGARAAGGGLRVSTLIA